MKSKLCPYKKTCRNECYADGNPCDFALAFDALTRKLDSSKKIIAGLIRERDELKWKLSKAQEVMAVIARDSAGGLACTFCTWNPEGMGFELDGSQFQDDGECRFTWDEATEAEQSAP